VARAVVFNNVFPNVDLFGVRMNEVDDLRRSARPVAKRKPGGPPCTREMNKFITEVITTNNRLEVNYVHQGWSLATISTLPPWILARMTNNNLRSLGGEGEWITKQFILQRLAFDLFVEELEPVPEFEVDMQNALAKPTKFEKFQALYRVLQIW
jgi:hypothetical protein